MAVDQAQLVNLVLAVLDETFEHHHGIFLDKGTSLFATLGGIDHGRASVPVGGGCASLAAQVAHVTLYLEVLEREIMGGEAGKVDWGEIWRTVGRVSAEEWDALRANLERTYRRVVGELRAAEPWEAEPHLEAALAITVHTAYHLGEIRQALCFIDQAR